MRLLVTRPMTDRTTRAIRDRFDATFRDNTPLTEAEAVRALADYDAIIPTLGDAFTAADAYLFVVLGWAKYVQIDLGELQHIGGFMARVAARPEVKAAMVAEGLAA